MINSFNAAKGGSCEDHPLLPSLKEGARLLGGHVTERNRISAPGPNHRPGDRSMSITVDPNAPDGFLVHSFSPGDDDIACKDYVREKWGMGSWKANGRANVSRNGSSQQREARIVAEYNYTDETGELLFQVVRLEPKDFRQRRPDGQGGWLWSIGETRRVLYRLPEVGEAVGLKRTIFIAEGEKAVDALVQLGVPATCSPGGAGKWRKEQAQHLVDADVVILPDKDESGERHREIVEKSLDGVAARVRILRLPGLPPKGDPYDWVHAGGTAEQLWQVVEREAVAPNEPQPHKVADDAWTVAHWLTRDIPEPDFLLGHWLGPSTRALLVGATGLGKTMLGLAIGFAVANKTDLFHWTAKRQGRVLYVDGEMSRRQMKKRIHDAVERAGGVVPDTMTVISKEDYEDMPPLNTEAGQEWMDSFILRHGPFDLIIFDNIQALLVGDMKDEEQWAKVLPWVRSLTRRSIGQIWFHHTGHDETRSYGSKAREWQMDVVAIMERVDDTDADLAFSLKFTKARERTPETKEDFEPIIMRLKG